MSGALLRALAGICALALALCAIPVSAHLTPNSEVRLDPRGGMVLADIIVPRGEYAYATGNPVDGTPASLAAARDYLQSRFAVSSPDGTRWAVAIDRIEFVQIAGPPDLHATARLIPPRGADATRFAIDWRVVVEELPSHFALFVDERAGGENTILGAVRQGQTRLEADLREPGAWALFSNAIALGVQHIAGGYDHLLFLLALLLSAPLVARGGRWRDTRGLRDTLMQLARIVTAFTVGHSLTLIAATLGGWSLPTAPVEIAIAVSVLVSAVHAIRPLAPGREALIAAAFGLVHGLAFATLVRHADAGAASSVASLLGFNLGIELVQLGVVVAVAPSLLILARGRRYAPIRVSLGAFAVAASVGWIVNRTTGAAARFVVTVESVMSHAVWGVIALGVFALIASGSPGAASLFQRMRQSPAR